MVSWSKAAATASRAESAHMSNPVQVKFEEFFIEIGPTNNARPLSESQANYILEIAEDLIYKSFFAHYHGTTDTDTTSEVLRDGSNDHDETGVQFKFAMLGLVSIPPVHPEIGRSQTTTILEFSGGIAYFEGYPGGNGPSAAEVQVLVSLALNEGDFLDALVEEFPYITEAAYWRGSALGDEDAREPPTNMNGEDFVSPFLDSPIAFDSQQNSDDQWIIVVGSACGAAAGFFMLLAFVYVVKEKQRRAFWRDDGHLNSTPVKTTGVAPPEEDAALDEPLDDGFTKSPNKRRCMRDAKQQSLHLRDSLRGGCPSTQDEELSDAGSSRLGRLLSSASVAVLPPPCAKLSLSENNVFEKPRGDDVNGSGDQDTSSCSHESSNESVQSKEYDTCPSDFEGNAIVKPNLLPITDLERFNDDDPHNPLPPSKTQAGGRDDTLISIDLEDTTGAIQARSRSTQEGFLAKYFHPGNILPLSSAGLSYFGSATHGDDDDGNDADCEAPNKQGQQTLTPRTATTAGDHDSRWSDVSSDYRTDDDFELDRAWDPDDTSVNSSENGKDIFSPMNCRNDEVRLLDSHSLGKHTYNLGKLRTPTKQKPDSNTCSRLQTAMDTEAV